jgi:hypothetical protein
VPETRPHPGVARLTPALRARRFHAAERYLTRLLAGEPALNDDQLAALRALLTPGGAA